MTLRDWHVLTGWVLVLSNAAVGAWATAAHWLEPLRKRALWWSVIAAEVVIFVQAILGVTYQNVDDIEPQGLHRLYGFSGIVAVGILYSYWSTNDYVKQNQYLVYGLGSFFMMGLGIRAMLL